MKFHGSMKERILELAEQADEYTDNKIQQQGEYHPDWHDIRDQKFAELIVRECLALADNIREGCEVDGEAEQAIGADWVGLAIARHFGVEE